MKKIYLLQLIVLLAVSNGYSNCNNAVSFEIDSLQVTACAPHTNFDIVAEINIQNTSGSAKDYRWEKLVEDFDNSWEVAICDKNNCYLTSVNTKNFNLSAGEKGILNAHFYPNGVAGTGSLTLRVYNENDTTDCLTLIYNAIAYTYGADSLCTANCFDPVADFSYSISGTNVVFTNKSSSADSSEWDLGDGETSMLQNPSHSYDSSGTYDICLMVTNDCGKDTLCKTVVLNDSSLNVLSVNAGSDTSICAGDLISLGGSPTSFGGLEPYTYKWTCEYTIGTIKYTASDFLNDTTAANPQLIGFVGDTIVFHLSVTDNGGNSIKDSIIIRGSYFIKTLDDKTVYLYEGDSTQLYTSVYGGINPISYLWSPTDYMSDSTDVNTYAFPDTTTSYTLLVTDKIGCQTTDNFNVIVWPTGIGQGLNQQLSIGIYPNPNSGMFVLEIEMKSKTELQIQLTNITGQIIYSESVVASFYKKDIDLSGYAKGVYALKVVGDGGVVCRKVVYR